MCFTRDLCGYFNLVCKETLYMNTGCMSSEGSDCEMV